MELFRRVMAFGFGMALVGVVIASLTIPSWLAWYNQPGGGTVQAVCDIAKITRDTAHSLIKGQLIGGGIGFVLGTIAASVFAAKRRKKQAADAQG